MNKDKAWLKEKVQTMIDEEYRCYDPLIQQRKHTCRVIMDLIDQLDEPEKVVIPKHVADWIDTHNLYGNNPLREYQDLENDFNGGWIDEEDATIYHWINKNPYALIDALRYGCEVEKEQKYQVIIRDGEYMRLYLCKHDGNVTIGTNNNYIEKCPEVTYLTEQEIKDYDERFWQFAVPVEEVTE